MSTDHPAIGRLERAVKRLVQAEINFSAKGNAPLEDHPLIERDLALAQVRYEAALTHLTNKLKDIK